MLLFYLQYFKFTYSSNPRLRMIFFRKEPPAEPPKPWPSVLNPCYFGGRAGGHDGIQLYDVHHKVTKCCGKCVNYFAKELQKRGIQDKARTTALYWFFRPDMNANDCKYSADCPSPIIAPRPAWADECIPKASGLVPVNLSSTTPFFSPGITERKLW